MPLDPAEGDVLLGPDDPRINWLLDFLISHPDPEEKILVISRTRTEVAAIVEAVKSRSRVDVAHFHEQMPLVQCDRQAAWFTEPDGARVMVVSEMGGEGRNFQMASHLVLIDLPRDPELLEQRIGRLDRIGQGDTIQIHLPYLEDSAQAVLFHWYNEGLNAFEHTCPAGHSVFVQLELQLIDVIHHPEQGMDSLVASTKDLHQKLTAELHDGRDRLLEYNSCRKNFADELKQRSEQQDSQNKLPEYMGNVFDCLGIDSEVHSENCLIIRSTDEMVNQLPGLPDDGLTITFDRTTALSFEDAQYLTWEHPLTRTAMDMVTSSEMGNTAMTAISKTHIKSGSILLECIYSLEVPPISSLQSDRYLPPTSIRVMIDEQGNDHQQDLTHEFIRQHRVHVPTKMANKIVRAKDKDLRKLLSLCEEIAQKQTPDILNQAHQQSAEILTREINRLKALRKINPNIRDEEIEFFEQQLAALNEVLDGASLRLDSLRVLIAI